MTPPKRFAVSVIMPLTGETMYAVPSGRFDWAWTMNKERVTRETADKLLKLLRQYHARNKCWWAIDGVTVEEVT